MAHSGPRLAVARKGFDFHAGVLQLLDGGAVLRESRRSSSLQRTTTRVSFSVFFTKDTRDNSLENPCKAAIRGGTGHGTEEVA